LSFNSVKAFGNENSFVVSITSVSTLIVGVSIAIIKSLSTEIACIPELTSSVYAAFCCSPVDVETNLHKVLIFSIKAVSFLIPNSIELTFLIGISSFP